jgi:alpha-tubulin suppressor-like RCC1 family protein
VSVLLVSAAALVGATGAHGTQPAESYESTVSGDGPVAYFPFGDVGGSGTVRDVVGGYTAGNEGVTLGGEGPFRGSKSGLFAERAASGIRAKLPSDPLAGAKEFTAEAWVDWRSAPSYGEGVFSFGSGANEYVLLTPGASGARHEMTFEIRTPSRSAMVTAPKLKANAWEYVAVTETSSGTLTLYVNGLQVGQTADAMLSPASIGSATEDYLGEAPNGAGQSLEGSLSNVAFYTKALSATRIAEHYNATRIPVNTSAPAISGKTQEGKTLKAKAGKWGGDGPITYTYTWQRCEGPGVCPTAVGTGSKYEAKGADVGDRLRVLVVATNSHGKGEAYSGETGVITGTPPKNTVLPKIQGEAKDGKTLTTNNGEWSGTPASKYKYLWEVCSDASCSAAEGVNDESSYRLRTTDIGRALRVSVTDESKAGSASASSAQTSTVAEGPPVANEAPVVEGEAREGQTLKAGTGTWYGTAPFSYAYRWERCEGSNCATIEGASGPSYVVQGADVGEALRVTVTAKNPAGPASATSMATAPAAGNAPENTEAPEIKGEARDGNTLSASTGTWTGTGPFSYEYQWERCDALGEGCLPISGATANTYRAGAGDIGSTLIVKVTAKGVVEPTASASSAPTATVIGNAPENTQAPEISGEPREGQTLSATAGTWTGTEPIEITDYAWLRCKSGECHAIEDASGEHATTYKTTSSDIGYTIEVEVTAKNPVGSSSATSAPTGTVVGESSAPVNIQAPEIEGEAGEGKLLTASEGKWEGASPISYKYQWERFEGSGWSTIGGANTSSYTVQSSDVAETLRVKVTAENGVGSASALSAATAKVQTSGGPAVAWGENAYGGLGTIYKDKYEERPVGVEGLSTLVGVASGTSETLGLLNDGTVASWGTNVHGQLGDGGIKANWELGKSHVMVSELHEVKAVAGGYESGLVLEDNGTVLAWGNDGAGQLGNGRAGFEEGTKEEQRKPKVVKSLTKEALAAVGLPEVVGIGTYESSNYAVLKNGEVMAWGNNEKGQLGIEWPASCHERTAACEAEGRVCSGEEKLLCQTTPALVMEAKETPLQGVEEVGGSKEAAYARLKDGEVVSWGANLEGELGRPSVPTTGEGNKFVPPGLVMRSETEPLTGVLEIASGWEHVLARLENGQVFGWGYDNAGQIGTASPENCTVESRWKPCRRVATPIEGLPSQVQAVSAGNQFSLALSGGKVYAWGTNDKGELGLGPETIDGPENCATTGTAVPCSREPHPVPGVEDAVAISAAPYHAVALLRPGVKLPEPELKTQSEVVARGPAVNVTWNFAWPYGPGERVERVLHRPFEHPGVEEAEPEPGEGGEQSVECGQNEGSGAPTNTTRPRVKLVIKSNELKIGYLLYTTTGGWEGTEPINCTFEWQRCTTAGACEYIKEEANNEYATKSEYEIQEADANDTIRVVVTAKNDAGSTLATSEPTEVVQAVGIGRFEKSEGKKFKEGDEPSSYLFEEYMGMPQEEVPYEIKVSAGKRQRLMVTTP